MMQNVNFLLLLICIGSQALSTGPFKLNRELFDLSQGKAAPPRTAPKHVLPDCICGQINNARQDDNKIINGQAVRPRHKYPWMVALKKSGRFNCGGSLINDRFVLTAAHCVRNRNPAQYEVVMGVHNIEKLGTTSPTNMTAIRFGQRSGISHIKISPMYGSLTSNSHDIALLKLSTPVKFTTQVRPICLPKYEALYSQPPQDSIIMGWGRTETLFVSRELREANIKVINAADCRKQSQYAAGEITDDMICGVEPGKDTCQGDSGGPLVIKTASTYTQLGIVSWGQGCALEGYPGVYSSVPTFVNFIYTLTRGGRYCRNPDAGL